MQKLDVMRAESCIFRTAEDLSCGTGRRTEHLGVTYSRKSGAENVYPNCVPFVEYFRRRRRERIMTTYIYAWFLCVLVDHSFAHRLEGGR